MDMPAGRFYTANVLSALAWAPAYLAPGMVLGHTAGTEGLGSLMIIAAAAFAVILVLLALHRLWR
jgi:undecaprenyl-diphosphatase